MIQKYEIKNGIIVFVVCTLFIQPLLTPVGPYLNNLISIFSESFNDSIYLAAATRNTSASVSYMMSAFFGLLNGFLILTIFFSIRMIFISNLENENLESNENRDTFFTSFLSFLKRKNKLIGIVITLYFVCFLFYAILLFYNKTTSVSLIYSFDQKIAILKPYVDEDVLTKLSSDWALMKSEKDYLLINIHLLQLAESNGITLHIK